jgi:predicted GNAT family acetyltransferase
MPWHLTDDLDEFLSAAGDFLRSRRVEHTVPLTLTDALRRRGRHAYGPEDPYFGWFSGGGPTAGACLRTPPHPLLLTGLPAGAAAELAAALAGRPLPAVNALTGDAEAFAADWGRRTGATAHARRRSRLYRLAQLVPAKRVVPGGPRVAGPSDRGLLVAWVEQFQHDIGDSADRAADIVDGKLDHRGLTLWEVDGVPVSMAGVSRPEAGMVRVQAVYTPKELRGHGYGGAVTTAVTRAALGAGAAEVVLFTDLANPTSNALYQRLGYRPVEDRVVLEFSA